MFLAGRGAIFHPKPQLMWRDEENVLCLAKAKESLRPSLMFVDTKAYKRPKALAEQLWPCRSAEINLLKVLEQALLASWPLASLGSDLGFRALALEGLKDACECRLFRLCYSHGLDQPHLHSNQRAEKLSMILFHHHLVQGQAQKCSSAQRLTEAKNKPKTSTHLPSES